MDYFITAFELAGRSPRIVNSFSMLGYTVNNDVRESNIVPETILEASRPQATNYDDIDQRPHEEVATRDEHQSLLRSYRPISIGSSRSSFREKRL